MYSEAQIARFFPILQREQLFPDASADVSDQLRFPLWDPLILDAEFSVVIPMEASFAAQVIREAEFSSEIQMDAGFSGVVVRNAEFSAEIPMDASTAGQVIREAGFSAEIPVATTFRAFLVLDAEFAVSIPVQFTADARIVMQPRQIQAFQIRDGAIEPRHLSEAAQNLILARILTEAPTGLINGSNTVYTTTQEVFQVVLAFADGVPVTATKTDDQEVTLGVAPSSTVLLVYMRT